MNEKQEYVINDDYIQALIDEYVAVKKELYTVQQKEKDLIKFMVAEIDGENDAAKTITLKGVKDNLKIERRHNVSYPKDKNEEHPLRKLLEVYDDLLGSKLRVVYEESGGEVSDLIARVERGLPHTEEERMLVEELKKVRSVKEGKPGISVVERRK